jgi:hypothetical protein
MSNRQKMIKTGFFAASAVLVMIVATVAWFAVGGGNNVDTESLNSGANPGKIYASFFESPDADKDGNKDIDPETSEVIWNEITATNIDISNMVPGETHFYKIEVTLFGDSIDLKLNLNNILTTAVTPASKADVLGRLSVFFITKDSLGNPIAGTSTFDTDMLTFFGNNPNLTDKTVYDMDLAAYTNQTFSIYYNIGIDGGHVASTDDLIQGGSFSIGSIGFVAADNP